MKLWSSLLLFNLSLMLTNGHANSGNGFPLGEAFNIEGDKLLYSEAHCQSDTSLQREVFYLDPKGKEIAHKSLDYSHGNTTPAFIQRNYQTDEMTQVGFDENEIKLIFRNSKDITTEKSLDMTLQQTRYPIVVDAGFDGYIQQNWDKLVAGKSQKFRFALPTRGRLVDLKVYATSCSYSSESDQCFVLAMDNWLFRMLVDNIELGYDPDSRQLTRYRGLSNIEDANGNGNVVDIRYTYQDLSTQTCSIKGQLPTSGTG